MIKQSADDCFFIMSFDGLFHKKVKKLLPPEMAKPTKIIQEVEEHLGRYKQVALYLLIPLIFFYLGAGIFRGEYSGGSALLALIVSFYASFLPEADLIISADSFIAKRGRAAKSHEKYLVLFFAPLYLYLVATKKIEPIFTTRVKPFHNLKSLFVFSLFLFAFGFLLYASLFKAVFLALFGAIGYFTHLVVDRTI